MSLAITLARLVIGILSIGMGYSSLWDWWHYVRPFFFFEFRLGFGVTLVVGGLLTIPWGAVLSLTTHLCGCW